MTNRILIAFVALLSSAIIANAHDWRASGAPAGWTSTSTTVRSGGAAPYNGQRTRTATTWRNETGAAQRVSLAVIESQNPQWSAGLDSEYFTQYPSTTERIGYQIVPVYTWTVPAGGSVLTESVTESGQWYDGDSYISDSSSVSTEIVRSEAAETWSWLGYSLNGAWSEWSPDPATVAAGTSFTQSRTRSIEDRKKEISSLGAERNDQHVAWRTESESRDAIGTRNRPPTVAWAYLPKQITYRGRYTVKAAGHDPDGNLDRVVLQHRINGGAWLSAEDYKPGIAQPAATPGATVEYRAIAFDSAGADSGWITWGPVTVSAR